MMKCSKCGCTREQHNGPPMKRPLIAHIGKTPLRQCQQFKASSPISGQRQQGGGSSSGQMNG